MSSTIAKLADVDLVRIERKLDELLGKVDVIMSLLTPAANVTIDPADRCLWHELVRVVTDRRQFTAAEVRSHAVVDVELTRAIQGADIDIADDAKQLGQWLRRMAAAGAVDGLELVRLREYDRRGLVWRLRVSATFSTHNSLSGD